MQFTHLARLVPEQAAKFGQKPVLKYKGATDNKWSAISWATLARVTQNLASALLIYGIKPGDRIGLFSANKPECLYVDFATYSIRAVGVPMYATCTTVQIKYILNDAGIELLFVGGQYQYDRAYEVMNTDCSLKQLVIMDTNVRMATADTTSVYLSDFLHEGLIHSHDKAIESLRNSAEFTDLANILYTSGTTGEGKGVLLTHAMYLEAMRVNHLKLKRLSDNELSLCFLPMTHIFEKAWDLYCLSRGFQLVINQNPLAIQAVLKEIKPTVMCSVPRLWEKIYAGIWGKIDRMPAFLRLYFQRGLQVGKKYHLDYKRNGLRPPFWLACSYYLYRNTIFKAITRTIGIDKGVFFPVAGAHFSKKLCDFFISMGIMTAHGYGLTESTATVAVFDEVHYYTDTVGSIIDGLEVKIGPDNEVLLRGKTITPGYYNKPEETKAAFTADGFFKTGDAGILDEHGHLIITERIKDLFKTSNGKYIAPQQIESLLGADRLIDTVAVIGDGFPYVTALIVPNLEAIPELALSLGIQSGSLSDILCDERMHAFFETRIRSLQRNMAGFEQIRKFRLLDAPFSVEKGELTNTLKLRRKVIAQHYEAIIAGMY